MMKRLLLTAALALFGMATTASAATFNVTGSGETPAFLYVANAPAPNAAFSFDFTFDVDGAGFGAVFSNISATLTVDGFGPLLLSDAYTSGFGTNLLAISFIEPSLINVPGGSFFSAELDFAVDGQGSVVPVADLLRTASSSTVSLRYSNGSGGSGTAPAVNATVDLTEVTAPIPLPASVWMLLAALAAAAGTRRLQQS